jgi:hypothetical protein
VNLGHDELNTLHDEHVATLIPCATDDGRQFTKLLEMYRGLVTGRELTTPWDAQRGN